MPQNTPLPACRLLVRLLGGAFLFACFLAPSLALAATGPEAAPPFTPRGLTWIDWLVIVVYMAGVLYLGAYVARRQSNNAEYFTAAQTHISPFLVGISHFAALLSTISYLGLPGETISKGPIVLIGTILSLPIAYFIVGYWIIPKIMEQRVTSAYELLEQRLGKSGRLMGAIFFVKLRLIWMGLLVYVSSVALTVILGLDMKWSPLVAVVIGIIPLIYASMGGLRAVVIANVIQFFLLLLGAILIIVIVSVRSGGFSWWPTSWAPHWDVQPLFSWDPHVRSTMVTAIMSTLIWRVCTAGGDQMAIQHYMATRDLRATRRSYLFTCLATAVVISVLAMVGLALLGFFTRFPELMGPGMDVGSRADHLFPYFVSNLLPIGVSGLVVAAILAASSGMDTGVNAVTAVVMKDFIEPFGWRPSSEARRLQITKYLSFAIGIVVVAASLLMGKVPGNFLEMTNKLANLETTTIFGLFFLALFVRRATALAAVVGTAYGLTAAILVAFWDVITGRPAISFLYIGAVSLAVNLTASYLVSCFGPRPHEVRRSLIWGTVLLGVLAVGTTWLIYVMS